MPVCTSCSKFNSADVQFCIACGNRLALPVPPPASPAAYAGVSPPRVVTAARADSGVLPAFRPFGIVLLMVMGILTGAFSLFIAPALLYSATLLNSLGGSDLGGLAMGMAGVGGSTPAMGIILAVLLGVGGVFSITGAIGLWMLALWGRQVTAAVQVLGILIGLMLLGTAANGAVRTSGAAGIVSIVGLAGVLYSIGVILYLSRAPMNAWFRDA
jgi:hypothetical protein